jgi:uncharacterized membrane protein
MDKCIEQEKGESRQSSRLHPDLASLSLDDRLSLFLAKHAERLGIRVYHFVRQHWLGIINFSLFLFILGSLWAPYLSYCGQERFGLTHQEGIAQYIYRFYGFSCHQIPSRSFFILGHQLALCARCFSFYVSLLIFGLLVSLKIFPSLNRRTAFLLTLPIIMDVLLQSWGIRESNHLFRIGTAVLLSWSISFYIYPRIQSSINSVSQN